MNSFRVIYGLETFEDIQDAVDRYKKINPELGNRFFDIVETTLQSLKTDALLYQIRYKKYRAIKIPNFPFLAHYYVIEEQNTVVIDMLISTNRDPKNWRTKK